MTDDLASPEASSWWPTFRTILITGGEIALKVLPILLAALSRDAASTREPGSWDTVAETGPVQWQVSAVGGTVQMCNTDPLGREVAVTFSPAPDATTAADLVVLGKPGSATATAPVTVELHDLASGAVGISVLPPPSPENGRTLVQVASAIGGLALGGGAYVALAGGLELYSEREGQSGRESWKAGIRGPSLPQSAELHAKHPASGTEVTMKASRKDPRGDGGVATLEFPFPPGALSDGTDYLEDVVVTYELPHDDLLALARQGPG